MAGRKVKIRIGRRSYAFLTRQLPLKRYKVGRLTLPLRSNPQLGAKVDDSTVWLGVGEKVGTAVRLNGLLPYTNETLLYYSVPTLADDTCLRLPELVRNSSPPTAHSGTV